MPGETGTESTGSNPSRLAASKVSMKRSPNELEQERGDPVLVKPLVFVRMVF
jgi:hypothetical protein